MTTAFHLALPCLDLGLTRKFYVELVGATLGREGVNWVDINLFGNQLTFTKSGAFRFESKNYRFENHVIPSFHFGVIVDKKQWNQLYDSMHDQWNFELDKTSFLENRFGDHRSFIVIDPNGYKLEFKCFVKADEVFKN